MTQYFLFKLIQTLNLWKMMVNSDQKKCRVSTLNIKVNHSAEASSLRSVSSDDASGVVRDQCCNDNNSSTSSSKGTISHNGSRMQLFQVWDRDTKFVLQSFDYYNKKCVFGSNSLDDNFAIHSDTRFNHTNSVHAKRHFDLSYGMFRNWDTSGCSHRFRKACNEVTDEQNFVKRFTSMFS